MPVIEDHDETDDPSDAEFVAKMRTIHAAVWAKLPQWDEAKYALTSPERTSEE